ncbi:MAG: lysylphosphatidylglycerol synthase transmembrane domain-containing protein [Candidatus Omnitrophota bacterium]
MKKYISTIARILISFGLLGLLIWVMKNDLGKIGSTLKQIDMRVIFLAVGLIFVNVGIQAYRLKIIFKGEDLNIKFRNALELTFVGYFFNNFMPTAVGGDIIKAHYASKFNGEKLKSYASVFMDRLIGLYTFVLIAAVSLIVYRGDLDMPGVKIIVVGLSLVGGLGFFVITHKKAAIFLSGLFSKIKMLGLGKKLNDIYDIVHDYRNRKDVIMKAAITSSLGQCIYFSIIFLFFIAMGADVTIGDILLIMPIVILISMVPSLGGLGVREGAIVAFFSPIAGRDNAFAASLLMLSTLFFMSIIGGIICFWWNISGRLKANKL